MKFKRVTKIWKNPIYCWKFCFCVLIFYFNKFFQKLNNLTTITADSLVLFLLSLGLPRLKGEKTRLIYFTDLLSSAQNWFLFVFIYTLLLVHILNSNYLPYISWISKKLLLRTIVPPYPPPRVNFWQWPTHDVDPCNRLNNCKILTELYYINWSKSLMPRAI